METHARKRKTSDNKDDENIEKYSCNIKISNNNLRQYKIEEINSVICNGMSNFTKEVLAKSQNRRKFKIDNMNHSYNKLRKRKSKSLDPDSKKDANNSNDTVLSISPLGSPKIKNRNAKINNTL